MAKNFITLLLLRIHNLRKATLFSKIQNDGINLADDWNLNFGFGGF